MSTWQVRVNDCWLGASPGTSALRARAPCDEHSSVHEPRFQVIPLPAAMLSLRWV